LTSRRSCASTLCLWCCKVCLPSFQRPRVTGASVSQPACKTRLVAPGYRNAVTGLVFTSLMEVRDLLKQLVTWSIFYQSLFFSDLLHSLKIKSAEIN
jgi:hypothetical protein